MATVQNKKGKSRGHKKHAEHTVTPPRKGARVFRKLPPRTQVPADPFYLALESLGLKQTQKVKLIRLLEGGFPFSCAEVFRKKIGVTLKDISQVVQISNVSLNRRKKAGMFKPEESERLYRAAYTYQLALKLFEGNENDTVRWLTSPSEALDDSTPINYATKTGVGSFEVECLIGRLEEGMF